MTMNERFARMMAGFDFGHMTEAELSWRLAEVAIKNIARAARIQA